MNHLHRSMRNALESKAGLGSLWVMVLLALPNCSFHPGSASSGPNLIPGPLPHTTLVYCDIERPLERYCATDIDKAMGVHLSAAAVALVAGQSGGDLGLDDSPEALARCGGQPEAVRFKGPFPIGNPTCVNGFAIGAPSIPPVSTDPTYATPNEACVAQCEDYFGHLGSDGTFIPDNPPDGSVRSFCEQHAHASTSVPADPSPGFVGGCTPAGVAVNGYPDPRLVAERVLWVDLLPPTALAANSNDLQRTAPTTGPGNNDFNAGAASNQWIARGDGYVEFSTSDLPGAHMSHVMGLSTVSVGPLGCPFDSCADHDPSLNDLDYGISLNSDGLVYVIERSNPSLVTGPFPAFSPGERFRVTATENAGTHTATIRYSRIVGPCLPGSPCNESVFYTSTFGPAQYPLRVDATFRDQGAILTDVRIVRIH